ncbi:MAG: hypothetical protein ACXWUN_01060 [Allosphingosinicella sp.]
MEPLDDFRLERAEEPEADQGIAHAPDLGGVLPLLLELDEHDRAQTTASR